MIADLAVLAASLRDYFDWSDQGACRTEDPATFFPERGGDWFTAKLICAGCPVRQQCREQAIVNHEMYGIWGGTSERQRRVIRKQRGLPSPSIERRRPTVVPRRRFVA